MFREQTDPDNDPAADFDVTPPQAWAPEADEPTPVAEPSRPAAVKAATPAVQPAASDELPTTLRELLPILTRLGNEGPAPTYKAEIARRARFQAVRARVFALQQSPAAVQPSADDVAKNAQDHGLAAHQQRQARIAELKSRTR